MKVATIANKPRFIFLSLKRNILPAIFCLFTVFLVVFSKQNLVATKSRAFAVG